MTLDRVISALIESKNEAADDALLEALSLGNLAEQQMAMDALLRRKTTHGLLGIIGQYKNLPESLQDELVRSIKLLHHAIREAGRSDRIEFRIAAMKLIAAGRQGKLAYVLTENLHNPDEQLAKAAVETLTALARWIALETRKLQRGAYVEQMAADAELLSDPHSEIPSAFSGRTTQAES